MTPFEAAMAALTDAHRMLIETQRRFAATLLDRGLSPAEIEDLLVAVDRMERECEHQRRILQELAA